MSAARIIRALLNVTTAAHRAFANSEPLADASHARVINDADYSGLTRALFSLAAAVPPMNSDDSAPLRAELALRETLEKLEAPLAVDLAKLPTLAAWFLAGKLPDDLAWNVTVTADVLREVFPDVLRAELASMRSDQARHAGMRAELAAPYGASQVAPSSALPSRPDYWNIDTAGPQYAALARQGAGKRVEFDVAPGASTPRGAGAGTEPPSGAGGGGGIAAPLGVGGGGGVTYCPHCGRSKSSNCCGGGGNGS